MFANHMQKNTTKLNFRIFSRIVFGSILAGLGFGMGGISF